MAAKINKQNVAYLASKTARRFHNQAYRQLYRSI